MWFHKKAPPLAVLPLTYHLTSTGTGTTFFATWPPEKPDHPEPKDLGLAIEPIVAIRSFSVQLDAGDPILMSLNGVPWPVREPLRATCGDDLLASHDAPELNCTCGIYGWKTGTPEGNNARTRLWGEVYLWGDVLICEHGYRAEFAYPKMLHLRDYGTKVIPVIREGLEELYGVPVKLDEPLAFNYTTFS